MSEKRLFQQTPGTDQVVEGRLGMFRGYVRVFLESNDLAMFCLFHLFVSFFHGI